jgi:hypothetical protein
MKASFAASVLALLLCSAPAMSADAGKQQQAEAVARLFQPVAGKAVIYVVRDRGDIWTWDVPLYLNGREMGVSEPLSYLRWEVEPGNYTLMSGTVPPAILELATEPGGIYYVWQDLNPGHQRARARLQQVDQTTARATMADAVLLASPK